jgi:hypothetical protein
VVRDDAADWLAQAMPASVRLLHVDLYDHEAAAPVLDDEDLLRVRAVQCWRRRRRDEREPVRQARQLP